MNNISYGNYLYSLRSKKNLKQSYVAHELDITDKAVSKWENGKSKPTIEELKKLSVIYDVPLDELINNMKPKRKNNISKIVLTGGPCAGKTTALSWIGNYFEDRGYKVLFVPETATELIPNGIAPNTCSSKYEFQLIHTILQKTKEKMYEKAAKGMNNDKILIVCDRGTIDSKAFIKDYEFKKIMDELNTTEVKERDSYDAVFHLVTAAKGKEEYYTLENNKARTESVEEAKKIDDKIISSWTGHPHFRIIDNNTEFDEKLERLIREIASFLGEPEPFEIERKFLIKYPNIKQLEKMPNCTKIEIFQSYLKSNDNTERRIRARGINGDYMYYLTEKRKISDIKRIEVERRLTQNEYFNLLMQVDTSLRTIRKTRYFLSVDNLYFEIDIYPDWDKQAIMEIELSSEDDKIKFPEFIKVYKEVTDDDAYKNYNMAKQMPKQLINPDK